MQKSAEHRPADGAELCCVVWSRAGCTVVVRAEGVRPERLCFSPRARRPAGAWPTSPPPSWQVLRQSGVLTAQRIGSRVGSSASVGGAPGYLAALLPQAPPRWHLIYGRWPGTGLCGHVGRMSFVLRASTHQVPVACSQNVSRHPLGAKSPPGGSLDGIRLCGTS